MEMETKEMRKGAREPDEASIEHLTRVLRRLGVEYSDSPRELFARDVQYDSLPKLDERERMIFDGLSEACRDFSKGLFIYDDFGNDQTARRSWEIEYGMKAAADRYSKFGKNTMNKIEMALTRFAELTEGKPNTPGLKKIRELRAKLPTKEEFEQYSSDFSLQEKEALVERMDALARDFLRYFAPYESGSLEYRQAA
ncbi:MAG: hypothetical protein HYS26_01635 [Candidatus Kaiserbacteria bacterium]|nr:MAG: hypothetical protein HYS26_01635 [Candidatus Kaiserbacteria bacterium]